MTALQDSDPVRDQATSPASIIARTGFAFMPAAAMRPLLGPADALTDWDAFAGSWDDLHLDAYLPDGGTGGDVMRR
jgi:hypothetical protein